MLKNEDQLLRLVGDIHVAAADPDLTAWRAALARIGDAFGGVGVMMAGHRMPDTILEFTDANLPPQLGEYIVANLGSTSTNPMLRSYHHLPIGVPIVSEMMMDREEFDRQDFYIEVLRPAGYRDFLFGLLRRDGARSISMGLMRPVGQGPLGNAQKLLFERLLPHVASAAFLHGRVARLLAAADAPRRTLELLDRAIILVDAAGRVAYANPAAARVLNRRDGLTVDRGGALVGARPAETGHLRRLIATAAAAGSGRALDGGGTMALGRPLGRPYVVQVLPLAAESSLAGVPDLAVRPAAALLVSDPDAAATPPAQHLREAYGLTVAEAALASRLVAGDSLREAAESLGIGENTAKTQLKAVFAKLDVDRQTALVRRVLTDLAGLAMPPTTMNGNGAGHL